MKSKSIIPSHYCSIDDIYLIEKINSATRCVKLITPSISLDMAKVLISSYDRLNAKVELITDVSEELFRFGINNLEAIRLLQNHAIDNNITSFSCKQGIRIASLIVDDEIFHFNINDIVENGIVSTLYPVFTTDENLDSKYLQYQLNNGHEFSEFAVLQKQGGSRTYMYLNKLKQLHLTVPVSIDEQKKIAVLLEEVDNLITLHQRKLEKLQNIKKSMLEKMFV